MSNFTAAMLGAFVGSFIPTFLLSRLLFWCVKTWDGGTRKIFVVHGVSLVVSALIGVVAISENPYAPLFYAVAQLIWLGVDLFRQRKRDQSSMSTVRGAQHI